MPRFSRYNTVRAAAAVARTTSRQRGARSIGRSSFCTAIDSDGSSRAPTLPGYQTPGCHTSRGASALCVDRSPPILLHGNPGAPLSPRARVVVVRDHRPAHATVASSLLLAVVVSVLVLVTTQLAPKEPPVLPENPSTALLSLMSSEIPPGRPGNLTQDQEEKLRQLWGQIFRVCGVGGGEPTEPAEPPAPLTTKDHRKSDLAKDKKKRRSFFSRKPKKEAETEPPEEKQPGPSPFVGLKEGEEDKYGQTKLFFDTLATLAPEAIRATIWGMVKHDHPDALALRFLRARKWDVDKALIMLVSTMNWRASEMHVDDDIMKNGEAAAVEAEGGSDAKAAKLGHDFLAQVRMGKSFLHGVDKAGRPICIVRVRLHRQGEHAEESLERYTVYIIETARMVLTPPVDTATIVFDMTGFSMANMDYTPVKFMIKCFEANYPESLGAVLVHKAPWIFQGIWKIIRGWLDPVVASKVHFTNNLKEMEEFIPANHVLKELDGQEDWDYTYAEPIPGENDKMKDTATRDNLLRTRELLYRDFEEATLEWIKDHGDEHGPTTRAKRDSIARQLREDYWKVDPYIRARSLYDRTRVLLPGGKVDYYPSAVVVPAGAAEVSQQNGTAVASTDDVD